MDGVEMTESQVEKQTILPQYTLFEELDHLQCFETLQEDKSPCEVYDHSTGAHDQENVEETEQMIIEDETAEKVTMNEKDLNEIKDENFVSVSKDADDDSLEPCSTDGYEREKSREVSASPPDLTEEINYEVDMNKDVPMSPPHLVATDISYQIETDKNTSNSPPLLTATENNCETNADERSQSPPQLTELERRELEIKKNKVKRLSFKKNKLKVVPGRRVSSSVELSDETKDDEPDEFVWESYLEETGTIAVPPTSFLHVEKSLDSGFKESMLLEVLIDDAETQQYWVATVIMTCGPLLSLRYLGHENDKSKDFWCDISTQEVHPLDWCKQHGYLLEPPSVVKDICADWELLLQEKTNDALTPPAYLFDGNGTTPIDQIKQGNKIEVQDEYAADTVWLATIIENVGGRLLLRYDGLQDASHDFWLFYLSWRLHPVSWTEIRDYPFRPPQVNSSKYNNDYWESVLKRSFADKSKTSMCTDIFASQEQVPCHNFRVGLKIEMLNPVNRMHVVPATVVRILDKRFFMVEPDDQSGNKKRYCRHAGSWDIFYPGWAKLHGLRVHLPKMCAGPANLVQKFLDWNGYLETTCSTAAKESDFMYKYDSGKYLFERGMKFEAVNPFQPNQICAATINRIAGHLLWIQLDSIDTLNSNFITSCSCHDIFPVGWCESNNYPLKPPRRWLNKRHRKFMTKAKQQLQTTNSFSKFDVNSGPASSLGDACPTIYINHHCFSGQYLCKSKINDLSQTIGPGPVQLVAKKFLSIFIDSAYIPMKVHKTLEKTKESDANPEMVMHKIKAKYKGKVREGTFEVPQFADQVDDFLRDVCSKFDCCQYLFSSRNVENDCPDNCYVRTKTKYSMCNNGNAQKSNKRRKRMYLNPKQPTLVNDTDDKPNVGDANACSDNVSENGSEKLKDSELEKNFAINGEDKEAPMEVPDTDGNSNHASEATPAKQKRKYQKKIYLSSEAIMQMERPDAAYHASDKRIRRRPKKLDEYASSVHEDFLRSTKLDDASNSTPSKESPQETNSKQDDAATTVPLVCNASSKARNGVGHATANVNINLPLISNIPTLLSNPCEWSVDQVIDYFSDTDCSFLIRKLREQEMDGIALLLLNLPMAKDYLDLKLGPAIKLCRHVEKLKMAFYVQFDKRLP